LGSDHHLWRAQVDALESQYFIVSVDHLGHGESDVPAGDYTVEQLATAILSAADAAEVQQFHYCGLSVGGVAGQWIAAHHPQRLLSLTLSNTAAKIGSADLWQERIDVARSQGLAPLVDAVMARWFAADFASTHPEQFAESKATLLATDPNGYAGVCAALRDADLRDSAASITAPTLVIGGTRDLATPVEQARWLHEQISGSRLVELDAAHIGPLDCAAQFTATLDEFLASV
jgi:3-oxoadipate enol-lactonase